MDILKKVLRPKRMNEDNEEKSLTYADMKEFCSSLSDEQLQQPVIVWGDEKGGGVYQISETAEDMIDPSGDGLEPVTTYMEDGDDPDPELLRTEPIVMTKGRIILEVDF